MKNDRYSKVRGGWSRFLDITCEKFNSHICFYQKDGSGPLKRMYLDRMLDSKPSSFELICNSCEHELGMKIMYLKENRPSYRLFQNSVNKKIISQAAIK
jgi:hypothetical protein